MKHAFLGRVALSATSLAFACSDPVAPAAEAAIDANLSGCASVGAVVFGAIDGDRVVDTLETTVECTVRAVDGGYYVSARVQGEHAANAVTFRGTASSGKAAEGCMVNASAEPPPGANYTPDWGFFGTADSVTVNRQGSSVTKAATATCYFGLANDTQPGLARGHLCCPSLSSGNRDSGESCAFKADFIIKNCATE